MKCRQIICCWCLGLNSAGKPWREDAQLIALVGIAHFVSHFCQLLLPPLFPWLKDTFHVGYAQLGFLATIFFTVSCTVQAVSGFWVDRFGPRPILFIGLSLLCLATFGYSISTSYWMMASFAAVAGVGNGVFHPVDYTLLNKKISAPRLGHAYSTHGITGTLGWALAPVLLVPLTLAYGWRVALMVAGGLALAVLVVLIPQREHFALAGSARKLEVGVAVGTRDGFGGGLRGSLDFLRIPAVWMCFWFFLLYAVVLSVIQAFAPNAAGQLHGVPYALSAICLTAYMLSSAGGMVLGGFLASDPARCERVVGAAFSVAMVLALILGLGHVVPLMVPILFGVMGCASGIASPSRDLLVKKSTPENSTGRVYGVVYSGLDIGQAIAPLFFGVLMDHHQYQSIFLGLAAVQAVLIFSAFNVRRVRRSALVLA